MDGEMMQSMLDTCDVYSDTEPCESDHDSGGDTDESECKVDLTDCEMYSVHGTTDPLERDHCRFVTCLAGDSWILCSDGSQCCVSDLEAGMGLWSVNGTIHLDSISMVNPGFLQMFTSQRIKGCATALIGDTWQHLSRGTPVSECAYVLCTSDESPIICVEGTLVDIGYDYGLQIEREKRAYDARIHYSVSGFVVNVELF